MYYQFTTKFVGERILTIGQVFKKLRADYNGIFWQKWPRAWLYVALSICISAVDFTACKLDHSLRRQLETIAALKLNTAELHQSQASLSPVSASVIIRCPLILIHFNKRLSTCGRLHRSKIRGNDGSRWSDIGDQKSACNKGSGTVPCPSCGHPCSRMEIFMCRLRALQNCASNCSYLVRLTFSSC